MHTIKSLPQVFCAWKLTVVFNYKTVNFHKIFPQIHYQNKQIIEKKENYVCGVQANNNAFLWVVLISKI